MNRGDWLRRGKGVLVGVAFFTGFLLLPRSTGAADFGFTYGIFSTRAKTPEKSEFSVGMDWKVWQKAPWSLSLAGNWVEIHDPTAGKANLYPLFVKARWQFRRLESVALYLGAGGGLYFPDSAIPSMGLKDESSFAWDAVIGADFFGDYWMDSFLEGGFMASSKPMKSGLWHVNVGVRY